MKSTNPISLPERSQGNLVSQCKEQPVIRAESGDGPQIALTQPINPLDSRILITPICSAHTVRGLSQLRCFACIRAFVGISMCALRHAIAPVHHQACAVFIAQVSCRWGVLGYVWVIANVSRCTLAMAPVERQEQEALTLTGLISVWCRNPRLFLL